jgi:hypothetical protein
MEIGDNTGFVLRMLLSCKAGERFVVPNYLGHTIVEGTVDNWCRYMIGGCVVVRGKYNLLFLIKRIMVRLCSKEENRHQALHMNFSFC